MQPLYLKNIRGKGRGVFCKQLIKKDELIETAPLLIIPVGQKEQVTQSKLVDYFFTYHDAGETMSLALGFGSLYNHAEKCNALYQIDYDNKTINFFALIDIPANAEICINYAGEYGKSFSDWFTSRNIPYQK